MEIDSNYNVLIVDDSATTRSVIRRTIQSAGLPINLCLTAGDGNEAMKLLSQYKIDVMLTDLHMPAMGGAELIGRIKADEAHRHLAIVVISAEPSEQRLDALRNQGVSVCLRKPFTAEAVRTVIQQVLGEKWGKKHE